MIQLQLNGFEDGEEADAAKYGKDFAEFFDKKIETDNLKEVNIFIFIYNIVSLFEVF